MNMGDEMGLACSMKSKAMYKMNYSQRPNFGCDTL